ncbi:MAG: carboxymuconolactone decarboxylase family protein [Halodesulfovibrio sp.]
MYNIAYVTPEQAETAPVSVRTIYGAFQGKEIPEPLQLLSASPVLMTNRFENIQYYMSHETLSFPLLAAIRYTVARSCSYDCCTDFNDGLLKRCGMQPDDIETLYAYAKGDRTETTDSGLEDREQKMVRFVVNAVQQPKPATAEQLAELRAEGWSDKDIFDALSHGAGMVATSLIDTTFRIR